MQRQIRVCEDCQIPLIWTFFWDGAEYYCINCGGHWGMLGAGEVVDETPFLRKQNRQLKKLWKTIGMGLLPMGIYARDGCKKCETQHSHNAHLTKREKTKHWMAAKILVSLRGCFDKETT